MNDVATPPTTWKKPAFFGILLIVTMFFGIGGWSAYAKLASAVVASGTINVESNRKTVQHLEGGIIREILVREGQRVKKGELLFRLDGTQARASAGVATERSYCSQSAAVRATSAALEGARVLRSKIGRAHV